MRLAKIGNNQTRKGGAAAASTAPGQQHGRNLEPDCDLRLTGRADPANTAKSTLQQAFPTSDTPVQHAERGTSSPLSASGEHQPDRHRHRSPMHNVQSAVTRDGTRAQPGSRRCSTAVDRIRTANRRPHSHRPTRSMSTPGHLRVIHKGDAASTPFARRCPHPCAPSCTATSQALRSRLRRNARGQPGNAKVNGIRPSRNNTQHHPQPQAAATKARAAQYRAQKRPAHRWTPGNAPRAAHRFIHRGITAARHVHKP